MVTGNGDRPIALDLTAVSDSPAATRNLARRLGSLCSGGEAILLRGDLGAGKTCFVQGLALGLGVAKETIVTSPTFVLHAEYRGRLVLNHVDLYRLDDASTLDDLGIWDLLSDPKAVTAIEWPEMLGENLRGGRLDMLIADSGAGRRVLSARARDARHAELLASWLDKSGSAGKICPSTP